MRINHRTRTAVSTAPKTNNAQQPDEAKAHDFNPIIDKGGSPMDYIFPAVLVLAVLCGIGVYLVQRKKKPPPEK